MCANRPIRVLKFGGTSVANTERLENVAQKLFQLNQQYQLIVVVSAMAGVTNQLVSFCDHLAPSIRDEEVDVVLSTGEQITSGLLALKLKQLGLKSVSLQGWQVGIVTTQKPTQARIDHINTDALMSFLQNDEIPVIAGFQGVNKSQRVTTLGRGGSDTSAVAIAAALQNKLKETDPNSCVECDIYTDVNGVYTADPRFVKNAKLLDAIPASYMLELAQSGSKVLHPRSVQLALRYNVAVRVLSSFSDDIHQTGTLIYQPSQDQKMEKSQIYGIAHSHNDYMVTLQGNKKDIQAVLKNLSSLHLTTDALVLNQIQEKTTLVCMMLNRDVPLLKPHLPNCVKCIVATNKVKVTLVGIGLQNDFDILNQVYQCVEKVETSIDLLNISELKITFVVDQSVTSILLEELHKVFIA